MAIGFVSGIFIVLGGLVMSIPSVLSIEYCLQLNQRRQQLQQQQQLLQQQQQRQQQRQQQATTNNIQ